MSDHHPEFHARRRTGIGGSDVASILGLPGAYGTPYQVWAAKTAEGPVEDRDNALLAMGRALEPAVLMHVSAAPGEFSRHASNAWMCGHPDGVLDNGEGVEVKVCVHRSDTTVAHEAQCHWYMAVTDAPAWHLAHVNVPERMSPEDAFALGQESDPERLLALLMAHPGIDLEVRRIERDAGLEAALIKGCRDWWEHHVLGGVAPDPDGTPETGRLLLRRFGTSNDRYIDGSEVDEFIAELAEVEAQLAEAKPLEKRRKMLQQRIQAFIGDAEGVKAPSGNLRWSRWKVRDLDMSALCNAHPELVPTIDQFYRHRAAGRLIWKKS